jgi:inorganic pyrophosphatase
VVPDALEVDDVPDGHETPADFWTFADKLLAEHPLVIDRPRGCRHPRFPDFVYPFDYGYLDGTTTAADGGGIDVWRGSGPAVVTGALCTLDALKGDAEVKLLVGCTEAEVATVLATMNSGPMRAILVGREGGRSGVSEPAT